MDRQVRSSVSDSLDIEMAPLAHALRGQSSVSGPLAADMAPLAHELRGELSTLNSIGAQPEDGSPRRTIIAKVRDLTRNASNRPCRITIAKVRELTRNVCNSDYDPDHVSIGPYNYPRPQSTSPHLAMKKEKLRSLNAVLSAADPSMTVDIYVNELGCLELEARNCYHNTFSDLTKDQFVRMLLLDGCYILHRLVSLQAQATTNGVGSTADGGSTARTVSSNVQLNDVETADGGTDTASSAAALEALAVVRDVFYLAENQIPFFVLEKIGELTTSDGEARVRREIAEYALDLMRRQRYAETTPAMVPPKPPGNLLHLLHMHLKPDVLSRGATGSWASDQRVSSVGRWRTATEYGLAGVKFKKRAMTENGSVRCILDVKLNRGGGTLEVPILDIDNETWRLLRNLMELEQRNRETVGSYVTAYCVFMSHLACTKKDVELLSKKGVIAHAHGADDEVAQNFADLCKGIVFDTSNPDINYLWDIRQNLDSRFQNHRRRWIAWLRQKYISSEWLTVGLVAAVIGLLCTVIQTVFSVLSYVQGRKLN